MRGPFAISVAIHGAILALMVFGLPASAPEGAAEAAGLGGLEVSLGPAGSAPGGEAVPITPEIPEVEAVEVVETAEVVPEQAVQVAEVPPEVVAEPVVPTQQPVEAEPVEAIEEAPDIVEVVAQAVIQPPPPPKMKPPVPRQETAREAPQDPPVPQQPAEAAPVPTPEAPPKQIAAVLPGSGGKSGTEDQPETGSGNASAGGGIPGTTADYMAVLQAWLEKHKEYPRRAQLRRQEGTVLLRFVMDREGHVLSYRIEEGSGHAALDREVEAMIERAQPLPVMPDEMQQAQLELSVPIQFFLR